MEYLNFELEIGEGEGREYPVAVVSSPAGEARQIALFPFDELELQSRLKDVQIALLRSGGERRKTLSPHQQAVQDFGQRLFKALMSGELLSRFDVSLREAQRDGKGLRVKLRFQSSYLATLPWEFMYDDRVGEYLVLSRDTPVVRYLEIPQTVPSLAVAPPLRVLAMVASPSSLPALDISQEKNRIENALDPLRRQGTLELTWLEGQGWRDLQRAMRQGPWHVFHFIGHGGFDQQADEGLIALVGEDARADPFTATQVGRLLANHDSLRLVLLNACEGAKGSSQDVFSSTASIIVRRGIPAVVAMQYEITDRAAIEFARSFYEAIADGLPVDSAVGEARVAISCAVANSVEWGTPVLYMRAPDGVLFNIGKRIEEPVCGRPAQAPPAPSGPVEPRAVLPVAPGRAGRKSLEESLIEQLIGSQRSAITYYLVYTVGLAVLGVLVITAGLVIAERTGLSQDVRDILKLIIGIGGVFVSTLSAFPLREILMRRDKMGIFENVKLRLQELSQGRGGPDHAEAKRIGEMLWKVIEQTAVG